MYRNQWDFARDSQHKAIVDTRRCPCPHPMQDDLTLSQARLAWAERDPTCQAQTFLGELNLISCNVVQRLLQAATSAVAGLSCMQGELSKQEAAALEAMQESRARKLAALLSENKLQALQQKKAVEEALAQASGHAALQDGYRRPEQQGVAQAGKPRQWHGARICS